MKFRKILKRLLKPARPATECHECERLNRDEADAAIELVGADESLAARNRLLDVREQLAAHHGVHHPPQCSVLQQEHYLIN